MEELKKHWNKDSDPTWMDIINVLSELNENGAYASVLVRYRFRFFLS